MTHTIEAQSVSLAIEEADVEVTIDRAVDCSSGEHPEVCGGLMAEDHVDAIKVLVALAGTEGGYDEARLLCDRLEIRPRAQGVVYLFRGVHFNGPLTPHDEGVADDVDGSR